MDGHKWTRLKRIAFQWVILKKVGRLFFKLMKSSSYSVYSLTPLFGNFIGKEISHYHFRVLNS